MSQPLVSVIVTTKNNADTIGACLSSIRDQTYRGIELIVTDNHSTDDTRAIATRFTEHVFTVGPERSAQRNFAAKYAHGDYIAIIDSDMELSPDVIAECVANITEETRALIIPEESFGIGFWAECKKLERSFYHGIDWIEAPRFFDKFLYERVGGYDESMAGGEDWDLHARIKQQTNVGRISALIMHNEGPLTLKEIVRSRRYYAKGFSKYLAKPDVKTAERSGAKQALGVYRLLLSKPARLFRRPHVGVGVLTMKTVEFGTIFAVQLSSRNNRSQPA